ncbi:hypothetical protein [uncultured Hoeflea sp.]|uniref:hypothetical protein n=1 Tax=uncultured Hoeflea sp. TaxID=538666 RepID=UPI002636413C|nr:hypothetical protein [uncultured Hoeflea sp.]
MGQKRTGGFRKADIRLHHHRCYAASSKQTLTIRDIVSAGRALQARCQMIIEVVETFLDVRIPIIKRQITLT